MARIFVSFLGTGGYMPAEYTWLRASGECQKATSTKFVQTAILELLPFQELDKVVILKTSQSLEKHGNALTIELGKLGIEESKLFSLYIDDDISKLEAAWEWFEKLQSLFQNGDHLILDVTHGFRIVPIVFSAAVGYLKRVKNVHIDAVLYGAHDAPNTPIVDFKDFYTISDWTEGVGRLVDTADSSFLRIVAQQESGGSFAGLNDSELLAALESLTQALRNLQLQEVESKARKALTLLEKKRKEAKPMEAQVLQMVLDKFCPLISDPPLDGTYTIDYLRVQLSLIKLLAEHNLFMQAFSGMREWLGSLGLVLSNDEHAYVTYDQKKKVQQLSSNKDASARRKADVFLSLLSFEEAKWNIPASHEAEKEAMLPAYRKLEGTHSIQDLRVALKEITKIRNGFDHGWTGDNLGKIPADLDRKAAYAIDLFNQILDTQGKCK